MSGRGLVESRRDIVEVFAEEPGVDVEGHRGGGVAEHPLNGLDVGAGGDGEAGGGVAQVVRTETGDADGDRCRV